MICVTNCLQDPKLYDKLMTKHGEQLDDKSLTICSGVDYTNINYQHVVCPDVNTAKVIFFFFFFKFISTQIHI